ncbi:MAG: hypothetical protein HY820_07235 [Acidobacteria bacterium]|nr:hypothetical protein [Acidobacteriota bacterium]
MTPISVTLTLSELELLTALAADQLFRREFIDPKLPGYKVNHGELYMGKSLLGRLRLLLDPRGLRRPAAATS